MPAISLIILFSLVGGLFSLIGAAILLNFKNFTERALIHLVTFSAGALLGAAFLNILPEAFRESPTKNPEVLFAMALAGVVIFFVIERILLRFHSHDDETGHTAKTPTLLIIGDSLHNFLDGVAITTSFLISVQLGIITALAVAAHEIPSEIGEFSVMLQAGWRRFKVLALNGASSLMTIVGALLAFANRDIVESFAAPLLALTAGVFIYIATSDLIPEINHRTRKDKAWHVVGLLLIGIITVGAVSRLVEFFIPGSV